MGKTSTSLIFTAPVVPGKYTYTLFFMSDVYLGLNQQYDVTVVVGLPEVLPQSQASSSHDSQEQEEI